MRCPNCAGELPAGSRFCGICGRNITVAPAALQPVGAAAAAGGSMSLFELPGGRRARTVKVALVLAIDAVLLGAGVVMIVSYLNAREAKAEKGKPRIEVMAPTAAAVVAPAPVPAAPVEGKAKKTTKKAAGAPVPSPSPSSSPSTSTSTPATTAMATAQVADAGGEAEEAEVEEFAARVRIVVESHGAQLERCYERAAKAAGPSDPLEGRIDLRFTLMPNGSAEDVAVASNTTGSEQLASCVADLFRSWSMPHGASRPIPLEWPVAFHPPA